MATIVPAGAGEVLGDAPDRTVRLLADRDPLHATWSRFAAGRDGADLHVHREHTDAFFVLDGELTLRLGPDGAPVALPGGTLALVPPLVVHGFRNASAADVRYLNLHAPGRGFGTFMRGLRDGRPVAYDQHDPPPGGGRSPGDAQVVRPGDERWAAPGVVGGDEHLAVALLRGAGGALAVPPAPWPPALAALFVLDGTVTVGAGDEARAAGPGAWVLTAPGASAAAVAAGDGARVLHVAVPRAG
jgi:quercetin dioxygenase-like cupin family protein